MRATWADFEKSLRRCPARFRVLVTLASLSVSYPTALSKAAGVEYAQMMGVMFGLPPKYSIELALIRLGLAREIQGPNGRVFEITERGRRKARQLTARTVREGIRRRAVRREVHVDVPSGRTAGPLEPPPAPLETSSWTFAVTHP